MQPTVPRREDAVENWICVFDTILLFERKITAPGLMKLPW
jgi:hypothetical protein